MLLPPRPISPLTTRPLMLSGPVLGLARRSWGGRAKRCDMGSRKGSFLRTFEERFWEKVDRSSGPDACWLWLGSYDKSGYGQFSPKSGSISKASRIMAMLFHGDPCGLHVLHSCDNPPCVNPRHLRFGTREENMGDSIKRGRNSNANKTHCKRGHPFEGDNVGSGHRLRHGTERRCLECHRIASAERRAADPERFRAYHRERARIAYLKKKNKESQ